MIPDSKFFSDKALVESLKSSRIKKIKIWIDEDNALSGIKFTYIDKVNTLHDGSFPTSHEL